jgi:hypothetical protein
MVQKKNEQGSPYRIRLKGIITPTMIEWLGDITILSQENGETLLTGHFIDQPALRGFLDQLWNLNFTVLLVERIENGKGHASTP